MDRFPTISGALPCAEQSLTRRAVLGGMLRLGAAVAVTGGVLGATRAAGAQEAERYGDRYIATTDVNLRSRSNTSSAVILVVPKGAVVTLNGRRENGFEDVSYQGSAGWIYADYLAPEGGEGPGGPDGPYPDMRNYTTDDLNLRESPGYSGRVILVIPRGAQVVRHHNVQPPWGMVAYNGVTGWVHGDYLSSTPPSGGNPGGQPPATYLRVTSLLNLRAEPSLGAPVLAVMGRRAKVRYLGQDANGFRHISYKGIKGWAHGSYLA